MFAKKTSVWPDGRHRNGRSFSYVGSMKLDKHLLSLPVNSFLALSVPDLGGWFFCPIRQLMSPHRAWLHVAAAKLYARTLVATLYYSYHRGIQEGLWIRSPTLLFSPWPSQIWKHSYHIEFPTTIPRRTASLLVALAGSGDLYRAEAQEDVSTSLCRKVGSSYPEALEKLVWQAQ